MEFLQVLTLNLCGFDPGLEAGSRLAIKSNLVIYLVPYYQTTDSKCTIFFNWQTERKNLLWTKYQVCFLREKFKEKKCKEEANEILNLEKT